MSIAERLAEWLPVLWFAVGALVVWWLISSGIGRRLANRVTKFGGFGLDFEFTNESAVATRETVVPALATIRATINRELAAEVRSLGIEDQFRQTLDRNPTLDDKKDYRATLHVQDPLFTNRLYQLLGYHPAGAGSGRTFSTRQGIIGLAWRLGERQTWRQDEAIQRTMLVQSWGMTREEAAVRQAADSSKVMIAAPIRYPNSAGRQVGLVYMDSKNQDRFGENNEAVMKLAEDVAQSLSDAIGEQLAELVTDAARKSPQLDLEAL